MRSSFALLAVLLFACSSDDDTSLALGAPGGAAGTGGSGNTPVCVAGKQESCPCLAGSGVQRCRDDGSGYEACVCPGGGESGAGGTESGGGTGGTGTGGKGGTGTGGKGGTGTGGKGGTGTGGSGTGGTGGTGTGGKGGTGSTCEGGTVEDAVRVPSEVLLVVDKSGSMSEGPNGNGAPKWQSLPGGIDQGLSAPGADARVGMLLFPAGKFDDTMLGSCILSSSPACVALLEDGGCADVETEPSVKLAPIADARLAIAAVLTTKTPEGGTPMRTALQRAFTHLAATQGPQERAVILVTDGQPNTTTNTPFAPNANKACGTLDDLRNDTAAAANASPSVRTFVIVLPGDAEPGLMSGLAVRGKTGKPGCTLANAATMECHTQLDPSNYATALGPAVADAIARARRGCVFTTPAQALASPDTTTLLVDGVAVPRDPARAEGWAPVENDPQHLQVYGAACDQIRQSDAAQVKIAVGCAP